MYDELYAAWRLEIENNELGSLPADFYTKLATYMQNLKEENQSQEENTTRTTLLQREQANATRMAKELIALRYRKMLKFLTAKKSVPTDNLATEEQKLYSGVSPAAGAFEKFVENLLEGHLTQIAVEVPAVPVVAEAQPAAHKRVLVRFLKPVPSIMGSDMQSYGPFLVEDVSSVPLENAKILVKQGLARLVEPS
jgi:DNA replication factor GINS